MTTSASIPERTRRNKPYPHGKSRSTQVPRNVHDGKKDSLPPELAATRRKLKQLLARQKSEFLGEYYQIGTIAKKGIDDFIRSHGSAHGHDIIHGLADAAECDRRTLHNCIKLVNTYDREAYSNLISNRGISSWSHVIHLLAVPDAVFRSELVAACNAQRWSADELAIAIHAKIGRRRVGSGRRPAMPRTVHQGIAKLMTATRKFGNLAGGLFGGAYDLPSELAAMPPDGVSRVLRQEVADGATLLDGIAKQATEAAAQLRGQLPWIDSAIENQVPERSEK